MKEYIERDYLVKEAEAILMFRKQARMSGERKEDAAATLEWLKYYAPAADVVEVRHGRWEEAEDDYFGLHIIKCSECREEWCFEVDDDVKDLNYNYCPNCGCKMDKEE